MFDVEINSNNELKKFYENETKKNVYSDVWKWQEFPFKKNMLKTMLDIAPALLKIKNLPEAKVYKFETFELK